MDERQALSAFGALSQETRLRVLRLLVVAGQDGMAAGAIAQTAGVSASNISFHLKELERAGLVHARRESRSVYYSADFSVLNDLLLFLMKDCCAAGDEAGQEHQVPTCSACCQPQQPVSLPDTPADRK